MSIPHIDKIRELRQQANAGSGAEELIQRASALQTELAMRRGTPQAALPGEQVMNDLATWEGLRRIRDVDAPPTASWEVRIRARELAMRSALAVLQPLASAAHMAAHDLRDLRKEQMAALDAPEFAALRAEIEASQSEHAVASANARGLARRLQHLGPLNSMLELFQGQLNGALADTGKNQAALCEAFARAAESSITTVAAAAEVPHDVARVGDSPQERARAVLRGLTVLAARIDRVSTEIEAELASAESDRTRASDAIERRLG